MPRDPGKPLFLESNYDDFDRFEADMVGWNLGFKQLDRGPFRGDLTFVADPNFHLFHGKLERKLLQTGAPPPQFRSIGIPAKPDVSFLWRGKRITGREMFAFPVGGELDCVSNADFEVYALSFRVDVLEACVDRIAGRMGVRSFFDTEVRRCSDEAMQILRRRLAGWLNQVRLRSEVAMATSEITAFEFCQLFVEAWFEGTPSRYPTEAASRKRILSSAIDLIVEKGHEPITVGELCELVHTSRRTMDYAFKDRYGVSPRGFIQAHRLNNVRAELKSLSPSGTRVADIANHWGFWHMGKFAHDYRRFFGELPSETLRIKL